MSPRSATEVDTHVGARLRTRRSELDMSQSELGEKLGVTFQQVQKYERGTNRLGASRLFLAGKVLRVPLTYFFEGIECGNDDMPRVESPVYDFIASPDGLDLANAFTAITDTSVRRKVIDLLRSMASPVPVLATVTDAERKSLLSTRATDGRPDDPHNGQCSVDDVARKYRGAA